MANEQASPLSDLCQYVVGVQIDARNRNLLTMWTVYDHPTDMPDVFVARCFCVGSVGPEPVLTDNFITSPDLKEIRTTLRQSGLTCLARNDGDDPVIMETWL